MNRQTAYYINSIVLSLLLLIGVSCQVRDSNRSEEIYTIKPTGSFRIYGIEIDKILSNNFSKIERTLHAKTKIDEEVSVIFIRRDGDFVTKTQILNIKDHVDILYGPVEDLSLYKKPGSVVPQSAVFYGKLSINEPTDIKRTIVEELEKNLPPKNTAKELLDKIRHDFIAGAYHEGRTLRINFDVTPYHIAYFYIMFSDKEEIIYRYVFSKEKEVYPYI